MSDQTFQRIQKGMPSINDWAAKAAKRIVEDSSFPDCSKATADEAQERIAAVIQHYMEQWVIHEVDEREVPADEGNGDGLRYNLVMLLRQNGRPYSQYCYESSQDLEISTWPV